MPKRKTHTEHIRCPECGLCQDAEVEHTWPWYSFVHTCTGCDYIIMESEWDKVEPARAGAQTERTT